MDSFPPGVIDLTITSPPYDHLRTYGTLHFNYQKVIRSLYRVMKPGGVVVWVCGDAVVAGSETGSSFRHAVCFLDTGFKLHDTMIFEKNTVSFPAKRASNRYTQIFEYMFVFTKDKPPKTAHLICDKKNKWAGWTNWGTQTKRNRKGELIRSSDIDPVPATSPRNNIWRFVVSGGFGQSDRTAYKHPATFPEKLVEDHIRTWSNLGDIVLDPMCGSGTTCLVAKKMGRKYIGIEVGKKYYNLSKRRLS